MLCVRFGQLTNTRLLLLSTEQRLDHPNIVKMHECYHIGDYIYVVMELYVFYMVCIACIACMWCYLVMELYVVAEKAHL